MPNPSKPQNEPQPELSANGSPNQSERFAERWRTVQEVAELEGLSERAIQKRCQRGYYSARRIEGDKGDVWEIAAASNGAPIGRSANSEPSPNGSPNKSEPNAERFAQPSQSGAADSDHATAREVEALRIQLESSRAEVEREREISAFLKLQIEEGNRNAGELRAALREALRAMPKQLAAGESGAVPQPRPESPQPATPDVAAVVMQPRPTQQPREPRPLWKVMFGIR